MRPARKLYRHVVTVPPYGIRLMGKVEVVRSSKTAQPKDTAYMAIVHATIKS